MTTDQSDIVERLREAARYRSQALNIIATAKSARNIAAGDVGAEYEWLEPEKTVEWKAADRIEQQETEITRLRTALAAEREECARVADDHSELYPCHKCEAVADFRDCATVIAAAIRARG